jgi:hypothetical protein
VSKPGWQHKDAVCTKHGDTPHTPCRTTAIQRCMLHSS